MRVYVFDSGVRWTDIGTVARLSRNIRSGVIHHIEDFKIRECTLIAFTWTEVDADGPVLHLGTDARRVCYGDMGVIAAELPDVARRVGGGIAGSDVDVVVIQAVECDPGTAIEEVADNRLTGSATARRLNGNSFADGVLDCGWCAHGTTGNIGAG